MTEFMSAPPVTIEPFTSVSPVALHPFTVMTPFSAPVAISTDPVGVEFVQSTPLATWTIPHSLPRRPSVSIYLPSGEAVDTDVSSDFTAVTITFAEPTAGSAVLI